MARHKLNSITWPNMPNDTYYLDADKVEYSEDETYPSGSVGKALSEKAKTDGYYSNLTAGSAEQLLSTVTIEDEVPYLFRTSGGSVDIGDRETDMLVGGTVAWNQRALPNVQGTERTVTTNGLTIVIKTNGSVVINGTAENSMWLGGVSVFLPFIKATNFWGHVVFADFNASKASNDNRQIGTANKGVGARIGLTKMAVMTKEFSSADSVIQMQIFAGEVFENYTITPQFFDLTQMFGSTIADYIYSLEQATAGAGMAWFRKYFPKPYYEYNTGELMSVNTSAHNTVGFNAWDEEWELGDLNTSNGQNYPATNRIRSKNYIRVLPNTTYYFKSPYNSIVCFYDANKNFVNIGNATLTANATFTTQSNVHYMRISPSASYGTTYNHDICINLSWDGERDGEYEEYAEHVYELDPDLELRGIPKLTAGNDLYYDGDVYEPDGTVTRKYGIVDLGTLAYTNASNGRFYAPLEGLKTAASWRVVPNMACAKYTVTYGDAVAGDVDKVISNYGTQDKVFIRDTAYSESAALAQALNGVYLVYELATPTTETAEPYQHIQIVNDFGTEEYVSTSIVPVGHHTEYQPNLRAKLEMAPNSPNDGDGDYIVRQSNGENTYVKLVIPQELPTTPSENGTYSLKVTVSNGTATLSWEA